MERISVLSQRARLPLRFGPLQSGDPVFSPGASKTATISIIVSGAGLPCTLELYLSTTLDSSGKVASAGVQNFISTGTAQLFTCPITMPMTSGKYNVLVDVKTSDILLAGYVATETVTITGIGIGTATWAQSTLHPPVLLPSIQGTLAVPVTVNVAGLSGTVFAYLTPRGLATIAAESTPVAFTSTGSQQTVTCTLLMPAASGEYVVNIDVSAGGLAGHFMNNEDVFVAGVTLSVLWPAKFSKFDLDSDGYVGPGDEAIIEKVIAHIITDPALVAAADVNGDGVVNAGDITREEQHYFSILPSMTTFLTYLGTTVNYSDHVSVACDLDGNGIIDDTDYLMLASVLSRPLEALEILPTQATGFDMSAMMSMFMNIMMMAVMMSMVMPMIKSPSGQ